MLLQNVKIHSESYCFFTRFDENWRLEIFLNSIAKRYERIVIIFDNYCGKTNTITRGGFRVTVNIK